VTRRPLPPRQNNYHLLPVVDVVQETADTRSVVIDVPRHLKEKFQYRPGQFLTVRIRLSGNHHIRCYSMSSSPATDGQLRVTVKRVAGGVVSNWINDWMKPGLKVEVMPPAGDFVLPEGGPERDLVAFSSGSGITPVISIIRTALATTQRRVRLLYANQSRESVIFAGALADLETEYAGRLHVVHHIYDEVGHVRQEQVLEFLGAATDLDVFVCGSRSFTATAREALAVSNVPHAQVHFENFTSEAALASADEADPGAQVDRDAVMASSRTEKVVFYIRGEEHTIEYDKGHTLLEVGRRASLSPPFACESGVCGACIGFVQEGEVVMAGSAKSLAPDELAAGWVLACRAIPMSPCVAIEFPK
jgi:3-ketosteroid 9alpha-monooxygenase subunit B